MDKKLIFLISLLAILVMALVYFLVTTVNLSPKKNECEVARFSDPNGINLLFFGSKTDVLSYTNYFLNSVPFNVNKGAFNVYYIDDYIPACKMYRGIAILCHSRDLVRVAASCPHDYIVVLNDAPEHIRSSAYASVMSINRNHPKSVFLHEFGHVFANFAEEYAPAKIPSKAKNCVSDCSSFGSTADGCYQECSIGSRYRSIENGVMRTLDSENYGSFNNEVIHSKIETLSSAKVTGRALDESIPCSYQNNYLVDGYVLNGKIMIDQITLQNGCANTGGSGDQEIVISDSAGTILSKSEVNVMTIYTDAPGEGYLSQIDGETLSYEGEISFTIPIIPGAETVSLVDENQVSLAQASFSEVRNRLCQL